MVRMLSRMILPLRVCLWPHVPGLRFLEFPFVVWAAMIWLSFTSAKGLRWRKTGTEMLLASSILTTSSLSNYPLPPPQKGKRTESRSRIKEETKYNGKKKEETGKKREKRLKPTSAVVYSQKQTLRAQISKESVLLNLDLYVPFFSNLSNMNF